ncbi:hypothetical protein ACO1O0_002199 [Amphichorda felina]
MALAVYGIVFGAFVVYHIGLVIYRLFFHPLAKFPGPKIAAATGWYEAYFDIVKGLGGQYMWEMDRLHEQYGPIIRINPHEIHVSDSSWVDTLYTGPAHGARDKYPPAAHLTGTPRGIFGTIPFELHRKRRAAISSIFSKAQAIQEEEAIYNRVDVLLKRIDDHIARDGFAELRMNFLAFTTDTITEYCLEESLRLMESEERAVKWQETISSLANTTPIARNWSWVTPLALKVPVWLLNLINPNLGRIVGLHRTMENQAQMAVEASNSPEKNAPGQKRSIFRTILDSPTMPPVEKEYNRISHEGVVAIAAGGETTGRALATATFFILEEREVLLPRMLEELKTVMPEPDMRPSIRDLERLPLLTAVIKETLRINSLVSSRFPLVPREALQYKDWVIPAGTPTSMSVREILNDPEVYEDPRTFKPDRWLDADKDKLELMNRNFIPFGRGSRVCLGINLAWAELYIVLACVLRRRDFAIHDTIRQRDIETVRDCFIGEVDPSSLGIRIKNHS